LRIFSFIFTYELEFAGLLPSANLVKAYGRLFSYAGISGTWCLKLVKALKHECMIIVCCWFYSLICDLDIVGSAATKLYKNSAI